MKKMVAFRLDEEIHEELRIYCIKQKTSIQKLLEDYIELVLLADKQGIDLPGELLSFMKGKKGD